MGEGVVARIVSIAVVGLAGLSEPTLADKSVSPESMVIRVTEGQFVDNANVVLASEVISELSSEPSVSLSRIGGRGIDPVIHGQGQERVDVMLDGIRVEGACPSRMDPPASRFSSALPPSLEVRTISHTLRWGAITGGQIVSTTPTPNFRDGVTTGHLTAGGSDNGHGRLVNASAAIGSSNGWLRLAASHDKADDYEDGDGQSVRSAYKATEGRADAAWKAESGFYIKGMVSRQEERDVKYAGTGMDTPEADTDIARLELGAPVAHGSWTFISWQADVDHLMDNFSLRQPSGMEMTALTKARTQGARLILDQSPDSETNWAVGVDYEINNWSLRNFAGTTLSPLDTVRRPDADRHRLGVFTERFYRATSRLQLGGGVRYDRVDMDADHAGQVFGTGMMAMSASDAYNMIYGTTNTKASDDNFSGFLSSDWRFSSDQSLQVTASHSGSE